jgi:peptidoglycan/xylan/chitin deacetylase (PgdA/CDA1 family)
MDIIIVCHTEYGFVYDKRVIYDKKATDGVKKGVINLVKIADKYGAKVTFAVMPEVVDDFPKNIKHELGLHVHPGMVQLDSFKGKNLYVGDSYLKEHCNQSINSTILRDFPYNEQLEMIKTGKDYLQDKFGIETKSFVAGRWSINNDTVKSLLSVGITHDCSAITSSKSDHYDWFKLPRICMPYHPSPSDYQTKGNLPMLIVPISHLYRDGNANPEAVPNVGLSFLKACFLEYYKQNLPLFHICLHSPCMIDDYYIFATNELIKFISNYENINFKFVTEINEYDYVDPKTKILPYLLAVN